MPKETKPKRPPKTVKEKTAIAMKIADPTRSMTSIVEEVYDTTSKSSATSIGSQLLTKLNMTGWLDEAGLTDEVLAANTARIALTAKKRDQFSGEMYDDNQVQLKGMEFAAKLKGLLKESDGATVNNNLIFQVTRE